MSFARAKRRLAAPAVLLAGALAAASPAFGDVGETIIQRCVHGQSLSGFSQAAYNRALQELGADAEEYTNCGTLIRGAERAAATGRTGAGVAAAAGPAVAIAATPAEQRALTTAAHSTTGPVRVGNQLVAPGVVHANVASALSSLPGPLLATIIFLVASLVLVGGSAARNRFRGNRLD
jgi:hypothetical protein